MLSRFADSAPYRRSSNAWIIFGLAAGLVLRPLAYLVVDFHLPPTDRHRGIK